MTEVNTRVMERYYQQLLQTETVMPTIGKRRSKYVTPQTIRYIQRPGVDANKCFCGFDVHSLNLPIILPQSMNIHVLYTSFQHKNLL